MTNQPKFFARRSGTPANDASAQHRWYGYQDALRGLGFRADYESFPTNHQRNYEKGRQIVAIARGMGKTAPKWPRNATMVTVWHKAIGCVTTSAVVAEMNTLSNPNRKGA